MQLFHLHLSNYRNFRQLDLELPPGASVFVGDNAQGKTNLLESIYLLSIARSLRAESEATLIHWEAQAENPPVARVVGEAQSSNEKIKLEIALIGRQGANGLLADKVARVNGLAKRLSEVVGLLPAVLFTAHDLDLITGPPSLRRRYLDVTISLVDRTYLIARQRFEKVLLQRNHLLKRIREGLGSRHELEFWDGELAKDGGYIFWARACTVASLSQLAAEAHATLAPDEQIRLFYLPRLATPDPELLPTESSEAMAAAYRDSLRRSVEQEIAAGMTLSGPHRDQLIFSLNSTSAASFASPAQQRTISLVLRLAEARHLLRARGESPLLLLDDVLSEMDSRRRSCVLEAMANYQQVLITTTDLDRLTPEFTARATLYSVAKGSVAPSVDPVIGRTREA